MPLDIIPPLVNDYISKYTTPETEILQQINEKTVNTHAEAHMLSGHVQGKFLAFISTILQPRYVLEIGTFTGYSALCLARGLAPGGQLHTLEIREEDAAVAMQNFKAAGEEDRIYLHKGEAKIIIPTLPYTWDLVFIDADKVNYIEYYELVMVSLSEKGLIIADNILFHGQVLETPIKGKNAVAIDAFNKHVFNDPRVEQVMLTVRDGLLLIKKK